MEPRTHFDYMSLALEYATKGRLTVSPNPMVGCVIVNNDKIVGSGFHERAGCAHAEINALKAAGIAARGSIVYTTLEPCCHYNKTPPCTDALIAAGIKQLYIACEDPNPLVSGKGIEALEKAGIEVNTGLCAKEAKQLNKIFFHYISQQKPFVIAKWAMSLDGKTSTHPNDSKDISCHQSRLNTHETREAVDAILIGAKTAINDNPLLTVRYKESAKHPIRIVLTASGNLPLDLKMFDQSLPAKTIIATTDLCDKKWLAEAIAKEIEVLVLPKNANNQIDLPSLLDALGQKEITSLLVEGGMTIHESFLQENLVNEIQVYLAPVIIGSLKNKKNLIDIQVSQINRDFYFTAKYPKENVCLAE